MRPSPSRFSTWDTDYLVIPYIHLPEPVTVLWGFRTGEELRENGAKHLIETPMELFAVID